MMTAFLNLLISMMRFGFLLIKDKCKLNEKKSNFHNNASML